MSDETPSTGPEPSGREAGPEPALATPAAEAPVPRQLDPVTEVYAPPPAPSLPSTPLAAPEPPTEPVPPGEPIEPTTTLIAAPLVPVAPFAPPAPAAPFAPPAPVAPMVAEPVVAEPVVAEPVVVAPVSAAPVVPPAPVAAPAPIAPAPPAAPIAPAPPPAPMLAEPVAAAPVLPEPAPTVPSYAPASVPTAAPPSRKGRRAITGVVFGLIVVILLGAIAWVLYDRFYADPTKNAQAGACLADLPTVGVGEDRAVTAARVVACTDPAAAYVVEGRLDRVSGDQATSATVCQAYPDATFIYRQSTGSTGYVLCLRKLNQ